MKLAAIAVGLVLTATVEAGEVAVDRQVESSALERPLVYDLYRPAGAESGALPVVYLLHGHGASHREWVELGHIDTLLDELIATGEIAPVFAVMPAAGKSWYVDSAARGGPGDYATAITRDLVAQIDATLPTRDEPQARAVMGLSMGGFGALHLALRRPGGFGHAVALSPAVFDPHGLSAERWPLGASEAERQRWFPATFGVPFDHSLYRAASPFTLLAGVAEPPRLFLASGDDDAFGFELGTVELFSALRRRAIPAELRIGDGGHDWRYWRRAAADALRWLDAGWPAAP